MSDLIARLEAMRDVHEPVTRRYHDQNGNPYTVTSCQTCDPFDEPRCETYLLLSVAIAAERRRQAHEKWDRLYRRRWNRSEGEFCKKDDGLFAAFRDAESAEDRALAALGAHLNGGRR